MTTIYVESRAALRYLMDRAALGAAVVALGLAPSVLRAQEAPGPVVAPRANDAEAAATATEVSAAAAVAPVVAPPVSAAEAKVAEELYEDGRKLFFQGKFPEAAKKLAEAVSANGAKTGYQLLLAKAYIYGQQPAEATKVLEKLLVGNPDHVEAGVELAELLSPRKQPDRVIGVLEPLLKYKHDYPLYHLLAEAHYQKEQLDEARGYYEKAVELNPQSGDDHYQLGNIYLAQQRFAKAAEAYETAGSLGISLAVYHFKLASVYYNLHNYLGRVSMAEIVGGEAGQIKGDRFLIDPVPGRDNWFYVAGPRSALYQVSKAQEEGIDIFDIHFLKANIWLAARRYGRAAEIYATLEEKVKKADAGLFWYSWSQAGLGLQDFEAYLARLQKAIEAEPDLYRPTLTDALVTVAQRYQQQGDTAKYIEFLQRAVENNPLSAQLHLTLGDAHWLASERAAAARQYRLVLELEPSHGERVRLLNRIREQATDEKPTVTVRK